MDDRSNPAANLAELLIAQAGERPEQAAVVEDGGGGRDVATTFAELDRWSARVAGQLTGAGVGAGDGVLVFLPMSAALYAVVVGAWRCGAVPCFLDPSARRAHLERCCQVFPPRALVAVPRAHLLRLVSPTLRRVSVAVVAPGRFAMLVPGLRLAAKDVERGAGQTGMASDTIESPGGDAPALVTFTSGSTGEPKAACRSHGFLRAQHRALAEALRLRPGEVDLTTLPVFALANLASGVTTVVPAADLRRPGAIAPAPVLAQVRRLGVTRSAGSPAFYERLCEEVEATGGGGLRGLNKVYLGGAPVFPDTLERVAAAAGEGARVEVVYGSTEAEPIAHLDWRAVSADDRAAMHAGRGLLVGPPVPGIDLRVVAEPGDGAVRHAGTGRPGEVVVAGDHVLAGYLGGRGDTETKIHHGGRVWHRTGDTGQLDETGRLWLLGRVGEAVETPSGTLFPFQVELPARAHRLVVRAALVGHRGEALLVVETRRGEAVPSLADLGLEDRAIDRVVRVAEIPLDSRHNAKVDYPALRRLLG